MSRLVKVRPASQPEDIEIMVILTGKNFMDILNVLTCSVRPIYVVVESRCPLCWFCGAAGYLSKSCPGNRSTPQPQPSTSKETTEAETMTKDLKSISE